MSVGFILVVFTNLYFELESLPKAYYRYISSSFDKCHLCRNLL